MNLQQLEYIIAIDTHRHFAKAAASCCVTQPTLSAMIQKLENELGIVIFDRSRQPVVSTEIGALVIQQARRILAESTRMKEIIQEARGEIKGELKIGIIPTVAPFLLPLFLNGLLNKYTGLNIKIIELTTDQIVDRLQKEILDVGILASPLHHPQIKELPLYRERFVVYSGKNENHQDKKFILPKDLDLNRLWILEEGHCFRSQVVNFCELKKQNNILRNLEYEAGSIDSLIRIINANDGITILPELAILDFSEKERAALQFFKPPVPVREISLAVYRHSVKQKVIEILKEQIDESVRPFIEELEDSVVVEIKE